MKQIDANTMQDENGRIWTAEPVKAWPQDGDEYYTTYPYGNAMKFIYTYDYRDANCFAQGNAFKHKANAEKLAEYRAAMVTLSKSEGARGFVEGIGSRKFSSIPIYWPTESQCKAAVKLVGEDKLAELLRRYHTERYFEVM